MSFKPRSNGRSRNPSCQFVIAMSPPPGASANTEIPTPAPADIIRRKPGPPEKYPWKDLEPNACFYVQGRTRRTLENLCRLAGKRYGRRFSVRRVQAESSRSVYQIVRVDIPEQSTELVERKHDQSSGI